MEKIEEIIEKWKGKKIPIEGDLKFIFEKDWNKEECQNSPGRYRIIITLCDNYTHMDGFFFGSSHTNIFYARHQNGTPDQIIHENIQFQLWLDETTGELVDKRRLKLERLKQEGHKIEFRSLP